MSRRPCAAADWSSATGLPARAEARGGGRLRRCGRGVGVPRSARRPPSLPRPAPRRRCGRPGRCRRDGAPGRGCRRAPSSRRRATASDLAALGQVDGDRGSVARPVRLRCAPRRDRGRADRAVPGDVGVCGRAQPLERVLGQDDHRPGRRQRDSQPPAALGLRPELAPVQQPGIALLEQVVEVELHIMHGEHPDEMVELGGARSAADVGRHGAARAPAQDVLHERGHVPPRPTSMNTRAPSS